MILTTGPTLQVQPPDNASSTTAPDLTMDDVQRRHILEVLGRTQGRIRGNGGAAEVLGMKTSTLYDRMNKLGIERPRK